MSTVSSFIGQEFAYAHGRIGVLQQKLLRQSDIDRLLGSHDRAEVEKILGEVPFTDSIDQSLTDGMIMLDRLQAWVRSEVEHMAPESKKPLFTILWMEGDAPLLMYLLKQKRGLTSSISKEPEESLLAYDRTALKELVENNAEDASLPSAIVELVRTVLALPECSPRLIDTMVSQVFADMQWALVRTSGSAPMKAFVRHRIDIQNIRTALRFQSEDAAMRRSLLLRGGTVAPESLLGNTAEIQQTVNASPIAFILSREMIDLRDHPSQLERAFADVLAQDIAAMWNIPLSIEPLFAFAAIALSDIRLIRSLLIGKYNELSPQEIKRMLPPFLSSSHYIVS